MVGLDSIKKPLLVGAFYFFNAIVFIRPALGIGMGKAKTPS
ncbi:hypothetical protein FBY05_101553 [Pseudomonas sp. SJZ083]|nr:hypothetical protein FBY05_101553 [Pseudomonas sp. SJZ083]TWC53972.1 hypothetical protein FBY01_101163 [Pseudomonas sp. SJZ077]